MNKYIEFDMKLRTPINSLFLILFITGSSYLNLFSQDISGKASRQSSMEAFSKGNYEQAYNEFRELLVIYSKDPIYKYYSGVCLVKLKRDPLEATSLLQQALQSASVLKALPSDAVFYLGRAQQMSGQFKEAISSYNVYTEQVGKKVAREQNVPELVQQSRENKGEVLQTKMAESSELKKAAAANPPVESKNTGVGVMSKPEGTKTSSELSLPPGYEKILDEALEFQIKADSLNTITEKLKKDLEVASNNDKPALRSKISDNELLASSFQKVADQKYNEAVAAMETQKEPAGQKEVSLKTVSLPGKDTVSNANIGSIADAGKESLVKVNQEIEKQEATKKNVVSAINKPVETYSLFKILSSAAADEKIIIDPEVPPGLIYRIQVAVFRNQVAPAYFKGITPVYGFKVAGTDKTNYYAGLFRRSADARKALSSVKEKGFKDAFIVAFSGGKAISADRALILEREWGKKPFTSLAESSPEPAIDTLPPTLLFRVEVIRSLKPLKNDVVEGIVKIAGSRGMDAHLLDDGNIVYLIGEFITFESAAEYTDLLIRNGYRESKVTAWLGKKEIPVETARQLFDNLK